MAIATLMLAIEAEQGQGILWPVDAEQANPIVLDLGLSITLMQLRLLEGSIGAWLVTQDLNQDVLNGKKSAV